MTDAATTTTGIDLSQLPAPTVIETIDYETIFAALLAALQGYLPDFDATVESDPAMKVMEVAAYREMLIRQQFNERALQLFLAYATGTNLDQLGALFEVERLSGELDPAYKARIQLAPSAFSVAGPASAYRYHALSADNTLSDASATSPKPTDIVALVMSVLAANHAVPALVTALQAALAGATWPGSVLVALLSASGDGTASAGQIANVTAALDGAVRPLTDQVTVASAEIIDFAIEASLTVFEGPDSSVVLSAAQASLAAWQAAARKQGYDINRAAIIGALMVAGVANVDLSSPPADIPVSLTQCANCTSASVTVVASE